MISRLQPNSFSFDVGVKTVKVASHSFDTQGEEETLPSEVEAYECGVAGVQVSLERA